MLAPSVTAKLQVQRIEAAHCHWQSRRPDDRQRLAMEGVVAAGTNQVVGVGREVQFIDHRDRVSTGVEVMTQLRLGHQIAIDVHL